MTNKGNFVSPEELARQERLAVLVRERIAGKNKRAFVYTLGCQQNEADSERLLGILVSLGYEVTEDEKEADILLVNTCAIREHAEKRALSIIGRFKHYKAKNPDVIIGVCGCMTAQEHRINQLKHSYHYVDFTFATAGAYKLPEYILNTLNKGKRTFEVDEEKPPIPEELPIVRLSGYKAWVSIMYGCNNFCTYCIVPYVRGRERSRRMDDIISEVKALVAEGYRDITLLGQNVNSYGKDLPSKPSIADLLNEISKIEGDFLIHLMTSHPKDASDEMIEAITNGNHMAPHFHLPLQSGSDTVLKKMNRSYTLERYLGIVDKLRAKNKDIALTTDIIVGFPGESDEDFEKTLELVKRVRYDSIFTFIYSPRKGTPAATMDGQIPEEIKHERYNKLCEVQNEISAQINKGYLEKRVRVLVDGKSKSNESVYTSRTADNKIVHFESETDYTGQFITLTITRADTFALYGEI